MTKSEVMFQYMPAGNEKDTKGFRSTNPSLGWEWNLALTEHKAKVLTTQLQCSMKFNMVTAWQNALPSVHYRNKVNSQQKAKKHFKTKEWSLCLIKHHVNVTQSLYRPGQALRVPRDWGSRISSQSAHEGGKVVSPMHRPLLPPRQYSWYSFLLEVE